MSEHSIVWLPMSPKVGFVAAIGATKTIHLPIFLFGDDLRIFRAKGAVDFSPQTLLYGILYGASDNPPGIDKASSEVFFDRALNILFHECGFPNIETMVLSCAANFRRDWGAAGSVCILQNGLRFQPESNKIKSDLIFDLWIAAEEANTSNHLEVFAKIVRLLESIDYTGVSAEAKKGLCFIATVAFNEVRPEVRRDFIECRFSDQDHQWELKEHDQMERYLGTGEFSWTALSIR